MSFDRIIILLGHENDDAGNLTDSAKLRCDKAIEESQSKYPILPTGAYGDNFNKSPLPHHHHLRRYLLGKKIDENIVLSGTNSCGTGEDLMAARKICVDNCVGEVCVVTSDYHEKRVGYIMSKVFPDIKYRIAVVQDVEKLKKGKYTSISKNMRKLFGKDLSTEDAKYKSMIRYWVDIPLYKKDYKEKIVSDVYVNAEKEHKHYDSISLASVSAMIALSSYVLTKVEEIEMSRSTIAICLAFLNVFFFFIYKRCADFAGTARNVMRNIEISYDNHGFSSNYVHQRYDIFQFLHIKHVILILMIMMTAIVSYNIWR